MSKFSQSNPKFICIIAYTFFFYLQYNENTCHAWASMWNSIKHTEGWIRDTIILVSFGITIIYSLIFDRMASAATTRGAACPRLVSVDKTRLKCSCGHNKTQTRLSWPWRVDWIHGARVSGGRWAWVSGDPAGLSRWRDLPRTAGLGERQPGN